jgi:hypothetical protein
MKHDPSSQMEILDVVAGLRVWRAGGETLVLDPLAPPAGATKVVGAARRHPPTAVVISSRITSGTSISSSAAAGPAPSVRTASTVTTSPR